MFICLGVALTLIRPTTLEVRWPPSTLQVHLWEDCVTKSFQMASFPVLPNCNSLFKKRKTFLLSLWYGNQWSENRRDWKGSHVRLLEHYSYLSAHGVNNVLLWFDPWPLTLTPPAWPPPDSQHSEVSQEVVNQTQWDQGTKVPIAMTMSCAAGVASCVCRRLLTLKQHLRMALELSTSSSSIYSCKSAQKRFSAAVCCVCYRK